MVVVSVTYNGQIYITKINSHGLAVVNKKVCGSPVKENSLFRCLNVY